MASSSHNTFEGEGVDDETFDQYFDQTFENLSIECDREVGRKKRKKRIHIERNREEGEVRLWNNYFSETPTYPENLFRRRFRMNKLSEYALGRLSLSALQKCIAAIRVLAYGSAADAVDEYLRLGETTSRACVEHFVEGVINLFGDEYLRRPTPADLQRLIVPPLGKDNIHVVRENPQSF
uniref:Uncharacterized protein n=1 Tax=Brassica oleracea var. oleracea TaxID=109376 RepID=A0A0D3BLD9_BRAOL